MFTKLESPSSEPATNASSATSAQPAESTPSPAPKKRGRPPKNPTTPGAGTLNFGAASPTATTPSKPKSAKKASKAKTAETADADGENPPPPKRRKVTETNETDKDAMDVDTEPVVTGSRKAKAKAKTALKDDDDSDASAGDKHDDKDDDDDGDGEGKKGAPKKKATPKKAAATAAKPKKTKKKKDSDDEDDEADVSDDDASGGEREDDDDDDAEGTSAAPKKRGRAARSNESYFEVFRGETMKNLANVVLDMAKHEKDVLFPRWFPTKADIKFITDNVDDYLPQKAKSCDFALRKPEQSPTEPAPSALKLDRFDTISKTNVFKDTKYDDAVLFTGGPIWGLDWCPRAGESSQRQFLALSSHKSENDLHVYGTAYHANNIVQVRKITRDNHLKRLPSLTF